MKRQGENTPTTCPVCHQENTNNRIACEYDEQFVEMLYERARLAREQFDQGRGIPQAEMKVWIEGQMKKMEERRCLRLAAEAELANCI